MTQSPQRVRQGSGGGAPPPIAARWNVEWICLALILVATLVVYWPAMNGRMLFDDDFYLTRPDLQSVGGLYRIWSDPTATAQYYPLALVNRSKEAIEVSEKAIEVARSTGQQEAMEQFEQWLQHYQIELRRDAKPRSTSPSPSSPQRPE